MHVLFVHQNFPAQFGHIARHLVKRRGWTCTFVSETPAGNVTGIRKIQYRTAGGARESTHYCSRSFENSIWHSHAVFEACKAHPEIHPDVIVGHSGFGSTLFLPELYPGAPVLNYFEFYYHPHQSDMDFRPEYPSQEIDFLRAQARNAMLLLDLVNCRAGYSPTHYQRSLFPADLKHKISVIFDGIETTIFRRKPDVPRRICGRAIAPSTRIVTYVSRGFESMRGFDIFMRAAKKIYREFPDVVFVVIGSDRICYGGDQKHIRHPTFREHVWAQDDYDSSQFLFTGQVSVGDLVDLLNLSDLHIYLTVPFVLSWSLLNALACGCTVLASDTPPVAEVITDGSNGLFADFFDVDGLADKALAVLRDPAAYHELGQRGADLINDRYALDVTLPKLIAWLEENAGGSASRNQDGATSQAK